jgi:hypothetical protein
MPLIDTVSKGANSNSQPYLAHVRQGDQSPGKA